MMLNEDEYRTELQDLAQEAQKEARSGEHGTGEQAREWLLTWIHETLYGHEFVIDTAKAQAVLAMSDNDGAYIENYGSDGLVKNGCLNWSVMAYAAMEADLIDCMSHLEDFDINDPNPESDATESESETSE